MIITRTPLRVSFFGGGTDIPKFYELEPKTPGAVISATINKYVYVTVSKKFDGQLRVSYSETENVKKADDLKHELVRESLKLLGISRGIEIVSVADVPSYGTGLGSSSSFLVGLANALFSYTGQDNNPARLAEFACKVEMDVLKKPIGKQDQYAAAYGGLNYFRFFADGYVDVNFLDPAFLTSIQPWCLMYHTGEARSADSVLEEQKRNIGGTRGVYWTMTQMKAQADELYHQLFTLKPPTPEELALKLKDTFEKKLTLASSIGSGYNTMYVWNLAMEYGAVGGKLLGAGGGGFYLILSDPKTQKTFHENMVKGTKPPRLMNFQFETDMHLRGSQIIYSSDKS